MAKNIAPVPSGNSVPKSALNVVNASGAPSDHTILMAKMNRQAADPANQPYSNRAYAPYERGGAHYGVGVGFEAHTAPEAGATLGNGRLFAPVVGRSAPNFGAGMVDHN